jgi:hypothetical protein
MGKMKQVLKFVLFRMTFKLTHLIINAIMLPKHVIKWNERSEVISVKMFAGKIKFGVKDCFMLCWNFGNIIVVLNIVSHLQNKNGHSLIKV